MDDFDHLDALAPWGKRADIDHTSRQALSSSESPLICVWCCYWIIFTHMYKSLDPATRTSAALLVDGGSDDSFCLNSPRFIEACRRCGVSKSDLVEQSEGSFRRLSSAKDADELAPAVRYERHEVNRHRLLREVQKERAKILREDRNSISNNRKVAEPTRSSTAPNPYSPRKRAGTAATDADGDGGGPFPKPTDAVRRSKMPSRRRCTGNPILEEEAQRLAALKRRQAMELQQMLAYELRCLARDERDRLRAEQLASRESKAEARRLERLKAGNQARLERERDAQERAKELEKAAETNRERQAEAIRRLEAEEQLRQQQSDLAAQRRAEEAAQKAAILQSRIARGARVRRARQLRKERQAAKKSDEREAAVEAARRAREAEANARKSAAEARAAAAHATVQAARRKKEEEDVVMRERAEARAADLEARAESFRKRKKEIAERERTIHDKETTELARQRQDACRRKVENDEKRRLDELESKEQRESQLALVVSLRKEQEALRRQEEKREREEHTKKMLERRSRAEEERCEATRRKLEKDAAKAELLRSEKERMKANRGKLSHQTAKQREALKGHFEALKDQPQGCVGFEVIAAAVTAAANAEGDLAPTPRIPSASRAPGPRAPGNPVGVAGDSRRDATETTIGTDVVRELSHRNREVRWASLLGGDSHGDHRDGEEKEKTSARSTANSQASPVSTPSITRSLNAGGKGDVGGPGLRGGPINIAREKHDRTTPPLHTAQTITIPVNEKDDPPRRGGGKKMMAAVAFDVHRRYRCSPSGATVKLNKRSASVRSKSDGINVGRGSRGAVSPKTRHLRGRGGVCGTRVTHDKAARDGGGGSGSAGHHTEKGGDENTEGFDDHHRRECGRQGVEEDGAGGESSTGSSLLRGRYDRELLAVLEKEQEAEGVRERTLAAAHARANLARARVAGINSDAISSVPAHNDVGQDFDAISECLGQERGLDGENLGESSIKRKKTASGFMRNEDDDLRREAEVAADEAKRLEEEVARERRAAGERVMRVSEAYEEAIRRLSTQQHQVSIDRANPPVLVTNVR